MKKANTRGIRTKNALQKINFRDLTLFEAVARHESLAGAARELNFKYPFVTKCLQNLEEDLEVKLVNRLPHGITLTPEGSEFLDLCKKLTETIENNRWLAPNSAARSQVPLYTLAGPTYLIAHLIAPIAPKALKNEPMGLRLYDTGNAEMLNRSFRDQFELAVHCDKIDWSNAWQSYPIGSIQWILCGRKNHPLGLKATEKEVIQFPFVLPTQLSAHGFRAAEDNCPIPEKQRLRVLESRTSEIGIRSVENTEQLIFVPHIQVSDLIRQNKLQAIDVSEWAPVRKTAYLTVHQDKVKQKFVNILLQSLEAGLTRMNSL